MDMLTDGRSMISRLTFGVTVWMVCAAVGRDQTTVNQIGSYGAWPTTWAALTGLDDSNNGVAERLDFVGNSTYPTASWAKDASYIYFRVRVDVGSVPNTTTPFSDTIHVLIDRNLDGVVDYGFSWDSNSGDNTNHGLEMTKLDKNITVTSTTPWSGVKMDDVDGNSGNKGINDINGFESGVQRTTDGYVRTIDGQATAEPALGGFGSTSFIDFAVSWSYLKNKSGTGLATGQQTWRIALASISGQTDHNFIDTDVAGGASTTTYATSTGWSGPIVTQEVPEPSSLVVLSVVALTSYVGIRFRRGKNDAVQNTAI